jgi:hypothetical protein
MTPQAKDARTVDAVASVVKIGKYVFTVCDEKGNERELIFSKFSKINSDDQRKFFDSLALGDVVEYNAKESSGKWYVDNVRKTKSAEQDQDIGFEHMIDDVPETEVQKATKPSPVGSTQVAKPAPATEKEKPLAPTPKVAVNKDNYWQEKLNVDIEKLKVDIEKLDNDVKNRCEIRRMNAFNRAVEIITANENTANMKSLDLLDRIRLIAKQIEHDIVNGIDLNPAGIIAEIKKIRAKEKGDGAPPAPPGQHKCGPSPYR